MSITNQIIIPVDGSSPSVHHLNAVFTPHLQLTPSKELHPTRPLLWKKTSSAFKKFKEKRDKKQLLQAEEGPESEHAPSLGPSRRYKLAQLAGEDSLLPQQHIQNIIFGVPFGYFDPNEAPLYKASTTEAESAEIEEELRVMMRRRCSRSSMNMEEEHREQLINRIEALPVKMEEEVNAELVTEYREGDPFIIVRRGSQHKVAKPGKTRFIKKERPFTPRDPRLPLQDRSLKSIILAHKIPQSLSNLDGPSNLERHNQLGLSPTVPCSAPVDFRQVKQQFSPPPNSPLLDSLLPWARGQPIVIQVNSSHRDRVGEEEGDGGGESEDIEGSASE